MLVSHSSNIGTSNLIKTTMDYALQDQSQEQEEQETEADDNNSNSNNKNNNKNNVDEPRQSKHQVWRTDENIIVETEAPRLTEKCVIIRRDENGFGFRVKGQGPVFVEHVHKNSNAWRSGIRSFDRICKVNGMLVVDCDHKYVVNLIKRSDQHVSITLMGSVAGMIQSPHHTRHHKRHKSSATSSSSTFDYGHHIKLGTTACIGQQTAPNVAKSTGQRKESTSSLSGVPSSGAISKANDNIASVHSFRASTTNSGRQPALGLRGGPSIGASTNPSLASAKRSESINYRVAYRDERCLNGIDVDHVVAGAKCANCSGPLVNTSGPQCLSCSDCTSINNSSNNNAIINNDDLINTKSNDQRSATHSITATSRVNVTPSGQELLRLHHKIIQSASSSSLPASHGTGAQSSGSSGSFEVGTHGRRSTTTVVRPSNRRLEIIKELLDTEVAHIERLRQLDEIFYRPMRSQKLVPIEQLKQVFSRHRAMLRTHKEIHEILLRSAQYNRLDEPLVGRALVEIFDGRIGRKMEEAASVFCSAQSTNSELLNKLTRRDTKIGEFCAQAARHVDGRLGLKDLLASCFQRLTKYPLLLDNLLKATPSALIDKANFGDESQCVARALSQSRAILTRVNEAVKMANSETRLREIWSKTELPIAGVPIDIEHQQLVHDGPLTLRLSKRTFDVHVLLLNDYLVILSRDSQEKFKLRNFSLDGKSDRNMSGAISTTGVTGPTTTSTATSTTSASSSTSNSSTASAMLMHNYSPLFTVDEHLTTRDAATDGNGFYLLRKHKDDSRMYEFGAPTPAERSRWRERIQWAVESYQARAAAAVQLDVHNATRRHSYESSRSDTSSRQDGEDHSRHLTNSSSQTHIADRATESHGQLIKQESSKNTSDNLPTDSPKNSSSNNNTNSNNNNNNVTPAGNQISGSKIEGSISLVNDDDVLIMPSKIAKSMVNVREAVKMVSIEQKLKLIDRELLRLMEQKFELLEAAAKPSGSPSGAIVTKRQVMRDRSNNECVVASPSKSLAKLHNKNKLNLAMAAAKVGTLLLDGDAATSNGNNNNNNGNNQNIKSPGKTRKSNSHLSSRGALLDLRAQIDSFLSASSEQ